MREWISDVNTNIDKAFELTHLPQLAEGAGRWVGSGFDDLLGTNITPTVSAISRDLPRMTAEALATLPLMATGAGAPVAAATWMNRLRRLGQVAGYGSSAVGGWDATGSPLGGAIAAGSLGLGNKLFTGANRGGWDVGLAGQEAAERLAGFTPRQIVAEEGANTLSKNLIEGGAQGALDAKTLFQQLVGGAGRGVTDVGAGVGLAELSRQGMMSVGDNAVGLGEFNAENPRNPFTAENIAGNVLNALPMAIGAISAARVKTSPKQVAQLHDWMNARRKAQAIEAGYDYEGPISPTQYHDTFGAVPADMQPDGTQSPLASVRQEFDSQGQVIPTENYWDAIDPLDQELAKRKKRIGASQAVTKSLATHFNVLEQQIAEGNTEGADETYRMIHRAFNGGGDLMTQDGRDYVTGKIKELDARARQMIPGDAPELVGFIEEVNNTIDMWNKEFERTKGIRTAQIVDPAFTVKTMDDLKRFNEAKKVANAQRAEQQQVLSEEGKTWSSKATEPIGTVEALDKAGLIEPLTQDWFKSQMSEELKRATPEDAYKIVLQKAVNQKLSQIPDALAKYKEMPQPDTTAYEQSGIAGQATKNRAKVDALEQAHYANFLRFPAEMREALARRDIDARNMGEFGGKLGRLENRYAAWKKALDLAAKSYDPATDTIEVLKKDGKKVVISREKSDWWTQRDDFGDYTHELASAPLSVAEGGTGRLWTGERDASGKKVYAPEKTITDLTAENAPGADAFERLDEEAFKSAVVDDEKLKGSFDDQENGLLGTGKGGEQVIPEQGLYMTEEQAKSGVDLFETKQRLQKRLGELSSEEAYYAGKSAFSGEGNANKKKLFKSAVMAALEDSQTGKGVEVGPSGKAFLEAKRALGENPAGKSEKDQLRRALKAYFGFQVEPPFKGAVRTVEGKIETRYDMQRLAHIVGSLLDDKKVEMARSIVKAQGGETGVPKPSAASKLTGQDLLDYQLEKEFGAGATSVFDDDGMLVSLSIAKDFDIPVTEGVHISHDPRLTDVQFRKVQEFLRDYNIPEFGENKAEFDAVVATQQRVSGTPPHRDLLVNTQPAGSLTSDVYRTFRHHFSKVLGDAGYSGSIRDLYTEMAVAIAQTAPNQMVDFYSIVGEKNKAAGGLANFGSSGDGRGQLGVNFNMPQGTKALHYAQRVLSTLAHEISHIDDFILEGMIDAPDAFSQKRRQLRENLNALSEVMTPDERHSILTVVQEALVPKGSRWNSTMEDGRKYGSHSPIEFVAVLNETIAMSLLHGKSTGLKNALEVLDYSPTEVRDYAQGMFRSLHDVLAGMQDVVAHPFVRKAAGVEALPVTNTYLTSTLLGAAVNAAKEASLLRHADKVLGQARDYIGTLSPGAAFAPPRPPSDALWMQTASDIDAMNQRISQGTVLSQAALPSVMGAIKEAEKSMSKQAYDRAHAESTWMGWFAPFTQRMEALQRGGFPIARPMADLAIGMEGSITRLRSFLLGDFVKRGPDGKVDINHENPLVKRISEERSGPWRDAVNEMSAWQQSSNDAKALFVTDPRTGQVMPDPQNKKGVAKWEAVSKRLSPEDQQFVAAAMVAGDKMAQTSAQVTLTALREQIEYRIATVLMSANKGMQYEQAVPFGKQVSDAFINRAEAQKAGNQQVMAQADAALAQLLPTPQSRAVIETYFGGKNGVLESYFQAADTLNGRTGHRPEQLQHDWVLRVKNPQGEVKYLSERSEYAANWRMRELTKEGYTQEGEIVTKDKLKNFTDVDDPDTLLRKYSEIEGRVWNKTIADVEANLGAAVAEKLQAYVPGTASIADATTAGLQKYIANRKGVVDRTKFDYIDGLQTNASRLAASIGYKKTQNMKNIMLSDPRARQFPSFAAMVNEHFDEMMTPTSKWSKEMKTASSAYMMGANISSMLINAAQSVTSLVPVLIQQDMKGMGPVAAWKLLGRAVADAADISTSKNWETRAALAERVDPKKQTLEEAKVALYRKRVLEGGIDHGIIHDSVFSGTDQQALMLARFGHGQYPPLSKAEMVRNPIYYVSQLALKPFGMVEQFNNKISFMAGVEQGHSQGLRGDELYQYARRVQTLSTYGGGKANAPGVVAKVSNPYTRSAFGVVNNLQQYGYGMVTTYAQLLRDSFEKDTTFRDPVQRRQAQKALGTMLTTQVALAGALGLPFAGAALAGLEKVFGIPANQLVREGLASLGSDDEQGAWLAETALNGLGNQLFGVDVSSRLGVSNLLGTSSYRGFNLSDLAGPTGGIIGNTVEALNLFGTDSPAKAAKALVPVAFKTVVEMSDSQRKYGDYGMRDAGGSLLYQPTNGEAIGYMLGFRPRELSQKRQAQAMLKGVEQRTQDRVGKELGGIADALVAGDSTPALQYVRETTFHDPTVNPQDLLRSLVQRGVDRQTEKDLLATGSRASEQERGQVARTFGSDVVTRQSEVQRALLGATLGARVGLAPDPKTFQKAALVDVLVQQRGMVRSEAVRLAGFLE